MVEKLSGLANTGGAAAAAAASIPRPHHPPPGETAGGTTLQGADDEYRVLTWINRATASEIAETTGLPIRIPPGQRGIGVLTSWDEDPTGKLKFGEGASCLFCIGQALHGDKYVGLKLGEPSDKTAHEVQIQKALRGVPHLLQALDFAEERTRTCQVLELAGLGNVSKITPWIRDIDDPELREEVIYHIAQGLLDGLANMADEGYAHLDVKGDNLLINHRGEVLVADFDCSQKLEGTTIDVRDAPCDPRFVSPERHFGRWSGRSDVAQCAADKLDSWSAGMVLLGLVSEREILFDPETLDLILYSDFGKLPPHLQRQLSDIASATPFERLQRYMELQLPIPDTEYGEMVRGLLRRLPEERLSPREALQAEWFANMKRRVRGGASLERLQEMVKETLAADRSQGGLSPQDLPQISAVNHIHRRTLQTTIQDRLLAGAPLTVLEGAPGMGKSQVAAFTLKHRRIRDRFGWQLWFRSCDDPERLRSQWLTLAQELEIAEPGESFEEVYPRIRLHFAARRTPCLIVFDNASEPESLAPFLDLGQVQCIVTTNSEKWSESESIGSLTDLEAQRLVESQLRQTGSEVARLCEHFASIPLALAQACAYIRRERCTIEEYLEQLPAAAPDHEAKQDGHRPLPSVKAMYSLTFAKLAESGALAALQQLAMLAPAPIPAAILKQLGDRATILANYALLTPVAAGRSELHRLPRQEVLLSIESSQKAEAIESMMQLLCELYVDERPSETELILNRDLLPHGLSLLTLSEGVASKAREQTLQWVVSEMLLSGNPRETELYLTQLEREDDRIEMSPTQQAKSLRVAGRAWYQLRDYGRAEQLQRRALSILDSIEECVRDRVKTLNNLGIVLAARKRLDEAIGLHTRALSLLPELEEHLHADSRQCLGLAFLTQGKHVESEEHLRKALQLRESLCGTQHLATADALVNLAALLRDKGEYRASVGILVQARNIYIDLYGEQHLSVAVVSTSLGFVATKCRMFQAAAEYQSQALAIRTSIFGLGHSSVANTLFFLAETQLASGSYDVALYHLGLAIEALSILPTPDRSLAVKIRLLAAKCSREQGNEEMALQFERAAEGDHLETGEVQGESPPPLRGAGSTPAPRAAPRGAPRGRTRSNALSQVPPALPSSHSTSTDPLAPDDSPVADRIAADLLQIRGHLAQPAEGAGASVHNVYGSAPLRESGAAAAQADLAERMRHMADIVREIEESTVQVAETTGQQDLEDLDDRAARFSESAIQLRSASAGMRRNYISRRLRALRWLVMPIASPSQTALEIALAMRD